MEKRIKVFSALLIFLIIVAMFTALGITNGKSMPQVKNVKMADNTTNSITVSWSKVKKADGYYIYSYDGSQNRYIKLGQNNSNDKTKFEIKDIPGASIYKIKVYAYKNFMNKEYQSENAKTITAFSLPSKPQANAFSGGKGVLSVEWNDSDNLNGYDIQYSLNKDFSQYKNENIADGNARNFSASQLNPNDVYFVRVRSYMTVEKKTVYSVWSDTQQVTIYDKDINIGKVDPTKPMVAFSFDDGPAFDYNGSNSTERILDVLEANNARATFFMVGERVNADTAHILKREIELGCELGNHTYGHNHYGSQVTPSDISKASKQIEKISGQAPTMFRCPGGQITSTIRKECEKEGMPIAYWSVDTEDWRSKDKKKICKNIENYVYDGSIVLMHDIYPSTADAVEKIVPELIKKGYQIVTVSELIAAKTGDNPKPGNQYVDYKTINNNTH